MTAPTNINFFADFQGLAALKNDAKQQAPAALKEAARQFESLFTQMMLKSMREANRASAKTRCSAATRPTCTRTCSTTRWRCRCRRAGASASPTCWFGSCKAVRRVRAPAAQQSRTGRRSHCAQSASSGPTPVAATKDDSSAAASPRRAAAREIGVDPDALLAQAALETGWGRSHALQRAGRVQFQSVRHQGRRSMVGRDRECADAGVRVRHSRAQGRALPRLRLAGGQLP